MHRTKLLPQHAPRVHATFPTTNTKVDQRQKHDAKKRTFFFTAIVGHLCVQNK